MSCTHTKSTQKWIDAGMDEDGEPEGWWEEDEESTDVDIDLHRYKCTQCGRIGYYSGAAREYHENGKDNFIKEYYE